MSAVTSAERRPTSYDVALRAGVSQSAVSRCFRAGGSISAKTRARVIAAAEELGYQPNLVASGLITRRTNMVAVVITNLTNLYYPEVLAELTRRLSERGVRVLLFTLAAESEVDAVLDQIWRYRVDGAIVAARLSPRQLQAFTRHRVPVVLYNRHVDGEPVSSVRCDSVAGERQLVDALWAAGHRCFGLVTGPTDSFVGQERMRAVEDRLHELSHPPAVAAGAFDYASGDRALRELLLRTAGELDALICVNDLMAIGAIDSARWNAGLRVPEDLSVVGFDGVAPAQWLSYQVATIRQPVGQMTEAAVTMLLARVDDTDLAAEARTFGGQFLRGSSARLG